MPITLVKILILGIIFGSFIAIIILVVKQFSTRCLANQRYDNIQKKCVPVCPSNQILDPKYKGGACRSNCKLPSIWSSITEKCVTCVEGEVFDPTAGVCVTGCTNDSDCGSESSKCILGKCCETPCLTNDGYKCCKNCNPDPLNPVKNICCSTKQICQDSKGNTTCCTGTNICINNKCIQPCGPGDDRNIACGDKQKCIVIGNVDPTSNLATQSKIDPNIIYDKDSKNIYTCVNTDSGCYKGNQYAVPPAINNLYPCFQIDKTDTATGLGFCSTKDLTNVNGINSCKSFKNKGDCNKSDPCKWYDVLQEMQDEPSQMKLNNIMKQTFDQKSGYYCAYNPYLSYGRAVGKQLFSSNIANNTTSCNYLTCINEMANPTVSDIYYNNKTGSCVGIQQCNKQDGLTNKIQTYDDYGNPIYSQNQNSDWTSNFSQSCDTQEAKTQCSNFITGTSNICIDGRIVDAKVYCNNNGTSDISGNCVCSIASQGEIQYYGRRCNLSRANCNNNGVPNDIDGTLKCACDPNSGLGGDRCDQVIPVPKSLPSDLPDLAGSGCGGLLLIPGLGVTFTSYEVKYGYDFSNNYNYDFFNKTPSTSITDYAKKVKGIYIMQGNVGINVKVNINFKNNNTNTTISFLSYICVAQSPTVTMEGSPVLNNYYYHSGSFLAAEPDYKQQSASVYYIGMNT